MQEEFDDVIGALTIYNPKKTKYIDGKKEILINAKKIYDGREMIINAFKNKIFPVIPTGFSSDEDEPSKSDSNEDDELCKKISNADNKLDSALIKKYFNKKSLLEVFSYLRHSKNKTIACTKQTLIEVNLYELKEDTKICLIRK